MHDLATIFAPAAGGALGAFMSKGVDFQKAMDGMEPAEAKNVGAQLQSSISLIIQSLTKEKQREWMETMRDQTCLVMENGNTPELRSMFDNHFTGKPKDMYQWLVFAISSQYDDFLGGTSGVMSQLARMITDMGSKLPSTSTDTPIATA